MEDQARDRENGKLDNSLPRKIAQQRYALHERRQQLNALNRLRADLGRQLASLDRVDGLQAEDRRVHLGKSIHLVELQIDEARSQVDGSQRVLRRLERAVDTIPTRRRRGRPRH